VIEERLEPPEEEPEPAVSEEEIAAKAAARAELARATLDFVDEGLIHRPTRAELILALLWAATLAPLVAAPLSGVLLAVLGAKELAALARTISGHDAWPLMVLGTAFFFVLVAALAPKTRARRLSEARVLVFERGRSFGPSLLLIVVLVELGILAAALGA